MLFEQRKKQNCMVASRGWRLKGVVYLKKTDKGRRSLYLGDEDFAIVTEGTLLVAQLVEALLYKSESRGFDLLMVSLEIFIDVLPAALWPRD
jgi:hypothetical protein